MIAGVSAAEVNPSHPQTCSWTSQQCRRQRSTSWDCMTSQHSWTTRDPQVRDRSSNMHQPLIVQQQVCSVWMLYDIATVMNQARNGA